MLLPWLKRLTGYERTNPQAVNPNFRGKTIIRPSPVILINPGPTQLISPGASIIIRPQPRGVWDDQGWYREANFEGQCYTGYYQVTSKNGQKYSFPGKIITTRIEVQAYISNPPAQIKRHEKGPCFQLADPPWFFVHWHIQPTKVDDAILYIENILYEVLT